jgi:hypothetical protein
VEDGFYLLFSPPDTHVFTSTFNGYGEVISQVNVIPSDIVQLDFNLPAGWVEVQPETLAITLTQGQEGVLPLTLANQGGSLATFELSEIDLGASEKGNSSPPNQTESLGWSEGIPIPEPLSAYAPAQCADDPNSFYLTGGQEDWLVPVNSFLRYDADINQWTYLAPLPQPTVLASATCYEDHIYVAGGYRAGEQSTLYIYDISANSWTQGANMPRATWVSALGAWNGHLYLAGGLGLNNVNVEVYDIQADSWVSGGGTPMPQTTFGSGWIQLDNYLYVVGGYISQPGSEANLTQRYDMASNTWELGPAFLSKRAVFALGATEKYLYAIGGDLPGGGYFEQTARVEILDHTIWPNGAWRDLGDPTPQEIGFQSGFCTPVSNSGYLWSVGGSYDSVYANDFNWYRPAEFCYKAPSDVSWLSEEPISGTLQAGETSVIQISFDTQLPELQPGEYRARLRVSTDTPYGAGFVPVLLTVIPHEYNMEFGPTSSELSGSPGKTITYTLHLTNTGTITDTYNLTFSGNEWDVSLPVTQTTLAAGEESDLLVHVLIPVEAANGEMDIVVITATSQGNPDLSASSTLTTTAFWFRTLLPLILKN